MATSVIQPSFSGGELSPTLFGRVDLAKYKVGAARLYNCYVDYRGGVTSRPGTLLVGNAFKQGSVVRLIKFQFSVDQTYVLELGDKYMRVIKNGGLVLANNGSPYVQATPWSATDLAKLKFAQANDVMTFTHPFYPIIDMARLAEDNWQLSEVKFDVVGAAPTGVTATVNPAASSSTKLAYYYVVTAVGDDGVESLASDTGGLQCDSFSSRTQTINISWNSAANAAYYNVYKGTPVIPSADVPDFPSAAAYGYIGRTQGALFVDNNITPDFTKSPPVHTDPFATGAVPSVQVTNGGTGYKAADKVVMVDATGYGYVGYVVVKGTTVVGIQTVSAGRNYVNPQPVIQTAAGNGAMLVAKRGPINGQTPGVVTYYQQRKIFAASLNAPATYWGTRTGAFNNMDASIPPRDTDALQFTLAALEQNPIKFMIPVQNGMIMLTGGAAWLVSGSGQNTAITPNSIQQTPQVYNGSSDVQPIQLGSNILYVQEKGYVVQDLSYNVLNSVFNSVDRTFMSSHLFQSKQIREWCWAQQPHYIVWACLSDGSVLSMTYIQEQEVFGWARHETNGQVQSVCCIPEGDEDVVYMAVIRPFGTTIERMQSRKLTSTKDAWTLDCALRYQGPSTQRVSGLPMADGETIGVVCDGVFYDSITVIAGAVNLPVPATNVLAGYSYTSQFQSLPLDVGEPTQQGKRKRISAVTARVADSKGLLAGTDFSRLWPIKDPDGLEPTDLVQLDERVILAAGWDLYGQVCLQNRGYPWRLLALIPEVNPGDQNG